MMVVTLTIDEDIAFLIQTYFFHEYMIEKLYHTVYLDIYMSNITLIDMQNGSISEVYIRRAAALILREKL